MFLDIARHGTFPSQVGCSDSAASGILTGQRWPRSTFPRGPPLSMSHSAGFTEAYYADRLALPQAVGQTAGPGDQPDLPGQLRQCLVVHPRHLVGVVLLPGVDDLLGRVPCRVAARAYRAGSRGGRTRHPTAPTGVGTRP